jgi:hypothetical protein
MNGGSQSTVSDLKPYQTVRIATLRNPPEHYDPWCVNQRAPRVGDVGTIVDILNAPGAPTKYVIECSAPDGGTIWLSDFVAEELGDA